jgi:two-component system OmpR family sensor kinase
MAPPIRVRLALVCGALVTVLFVALGTVLYVRLEADLIATVDAGLRSRAETQVNASGPGVDGPGLADPGDAFVQLVAADGSVLESSPGLSGSALLPPSAIVGLERARFFDVQARTVEEVVPARLLAVPTTGGRVVVVGASLDDQREALAGLLRLLLLAGPVTVILASGVGWLVARAAMRPVERMRLEAEAVSGSEPGRRLPVADTNDELARLGESLNRMLERLEVAVERERRFVDDASHEIRTPLANLRAELDLARRRARTPGELATAIRSAAEEAERLGVLADDLLVLARVDGGRLPLRPEDVDVAELVRQTVASFSTRAAEMDVGLDASGDLDTRVHVDPTRLRQALSNLVDNALRHTPAGGRVAVTLARLDGEISVAVADTGRGFEPSFLPRAFDPFSRADPARSRTGGGIGLGLAIVQAVARAHGGSAEAANGARGGAVVTVRIPAGGVSSPIHDPLIGRSPS